MPESIISLKIIVKIETNQGTYEEEFDNIDEATEYIEQKVTWFNQ